jgi:oligoribonuclease NrnB/cAMP/cGMP phosphodiesterase (DHH superfamily)
VQYGTPELAALQPTPGLLFADFSPPADRADEFLEAGAIVLDHHRAAKEVAQRFVTAGQGVFADEFVEPGVSGAVLAYRHVYVPLVGEDQEMARIAELIGIRDTWHKVSPDWNEACAVSAGSRAFPLDWWLTHKPRVSEEVLALGRHSIQSRQRQVLETLNQLVVRTLAGYRVGIFADPRGLVSDLADAAFERDLCEVVIGWFVIANTPGDLQLVLSCRSLGEVDVSAFCKHHGGGGHRRAASCKIQFCPRHFNPYERVEEMFTHYEWVGKHGGF